MTETELGAAGRTEAKAGGTRDRLTDGQSVLAAGALQRRGRRRGSGRERLGTGWGLRGLRG